jgi:hypothetical protein
MNGSAGSWRSVGLLLGSLAASACFLARDAARDRSPVQEDAPCVVERLDPARCDQETLQADLDGDGEAERILARRTGSEPEIGFSVWSLSVLGPGREGLSWTVHDYGEGSFVRRPGEPGCLVLATEWVPDLRRRGPDRYLFVGRWFRLVGGRLEPEPGQPVLARRNLPELEQERLAKAGGAGPCAASRGAPLQWLQDPSTETRKEDPFLRSRLTFRMVGDVVGVTQAGPLEVQLQVPGFLARLRYDPAPADPTGNEFARFGEAGSDRLYPPDYLPADPAEWLSGRRVSLSTYPQDHETPRRILWVGL